ncbi:sulfotransferase 1C3-like [Symsagittifera roscoffensis]|uniref:sulfotransferase 1C3-like n=1 Tax=Symsagittifera roscoffensis TaxID=84072 RepID=UPI00307C6396
MAVQVTESTHRFDKIDGEYLANGFLMYPFYGREYMQKIPDFPLDSRDLLLATYPRSGTTFTQRIISGLKHGSDAISTENFNLFAKFPHLDLNFDYYHSCNLNYSGYEIAIKQDVPRFIKTHVPLSIAPKSVHKRSKVLFVLRNPRDILVSLFNFHKGDSTLNFKFDFDTYFDMFLEGCVMNGDWCQYNAEWLDFCNTNPNRTLVITYEKLLDDFETNVRRLAKFIEIEVTDKIIAQVKQETNVETMKKTTLCPGIDNFVRKGVSGDWINHFSKEQCQKFDQWIEANKKKYPQALFDLVGE